MLVTSNDIFYSIKLISQKVCWCFRIKSSFLCYEIMKGHYLRIQMCNLCKNKVAFMTNRFCKLCQQLISTDLRTTAVDKGRNKISNDRTSQELRKMSYTSALESQVQMSIMFFLLVLCVLSVSSVSVLFIISVQSDRYVVFLSR